MSYIDHFPLADDLIAHLDPVVAGAKDPFIQTRYVGFVCVSTVTVVELCVRDILVDFATRKHRVFGAFCHDLYDRMNGRITLKDLRDSYVKKFGDRYVIKFNKLLDSSEDSELRNSGRSMKSSYGNLITWRHSFAHQGIMPPNASYAEAKQGFEMAKKVLWCLDRALAR